LQARGPKLSQEGFDTGEAFGPDHVEPTLSVLAHVDEPGPAQNSEMLRDGLLRDVKALGDLIDRSWLVAHKRQDRAPARLSQSGQSGS
jgi:hypothetical protein